MHHDLPPVTSLPWTTKMKPLDSASTRTEILPDGRLHLAIEHDLLRGITPAMLDHWFRNIDGTLVVDGVRTSRYTAWHPRDHVEYRRTVAKDGAVGKGSVFRIHEVLGRNPAYVVDVWTDVVRLDEGGFAHRPRMPLGLPLARMDYTFEAVRGGTRYVNSMTIGLEGGAAARAFNRWLRPRVFSNDQGRAWLLHNVEEVGNLEWFLPALVRLDRRESILERGDGGYELRIDARGAEIGPRVPRRVRFGQNARNGSGC